MDRIAELLAKGIENLDADELAELDALCHEETDVRLEAELTDDVLMELEEIATTLEAVRAETTKRAEDAEAREQRRRELADRIKGQSEPEETETEAEAEAETDSEGGEADGAEGDETVVEVEADPIAAAGAQVTSGNTSSTSIVTRVAARRPANHKPRARNVRQAALTASANVPGIPAGRRLDTAEDMLKAFSSAASVLSTSRGDMKLPVATLQADIPDSLMLGRDPVANESKLSRVTSLDALTASGGMCAPVPYRYDLPTWGDDMRPVRDALARFGAQRGGVRTITPPTIDVVGGGVGQWTEATDLLATPGGTEYVKPCVTVPCDDTEVVTKVYAITNCLKVGVFRDRWFPENIRANVDLTGVFQARYAESLMLAGIATGSKVVTHGQILGTSQDVFTSLRQLMAGIRYRHRIGRGQRFRVIGFEWVRDNILTDLIRKGPGDGTLEERLGRAEGTLDAFFTQVGANVTWTPDYQYGVALGSPGGPFAGAQGVGPVIGYPSVARFYVFLEGSWLFLDGGELNLGTIRDSSLVGTNDMMIFSETFENVHYHGLPGESYVYDMDICADGAIVDGGDITPCVSGS